MTDRQERRTPGVNRVQVARLVDICGRDQDVPAFEAQSVELSGRGMHVRTPYLPPLGAKLVCRLEDGGNECLQHPAGPADPGTRMPPPQFPQQRVHRDEAGQVVVGA